jgi:hypothetical protein
MSMAMGLSEDDASVTAKGGRSAMESDNVHSLWTGTASTDLSQ